MKTNQMTVGNNTTVSKMDCVDSNESNTTNMIEAKQDNSVYIAHKITVEQRDQIEYYHIHIRTSDPPNRPINYGNFGVIVLIIYRVIASSS
ncbi:Sulfate/thiosulfate import ATP-binding protein CysA [Trichinella spiralis]|uniref:Sulfate/thiosulfate import ATP-binding protein CysA n=1 Tax=Trichinella spiralis TaxID=6334 RepID=A0ABR3L3L3_TRISP